MNNTSIFSLKLIFTTCLVLGSFIALNAQCLGASSPPCGLTQPFEITSGGTYLYELEAKKEPGPSKYEFTFYVYSNQSLIVNIYDGDCAFIDDYNLHWKLYHARFHI
ncbi:MAG: hypothetical protein P8M34_05565 [Saprospiraceae bacterium]|nr:hypothetical protein [Saprospiraceae bacterium]